MSLEFGTNVTVFLLFFGIALLDAIQSHDWLRAAPARFWFAIGLVFLRRRSSASTVGLSSPTTRVFAPPRYPV
jgi:hypothetical protein